MTEIMETLENTLEELGYKTKSEKPGEPLTKCSQHVNTVLLGTDRAIWGSRHCTLLQVMWVICVCKQVALYVGWSCLCRPRFISLHMRHSSGVV